jgi:hypothetical protein
MHTLTSVLFVYLGFGLAQTREIAAIDKLKKKGQTYMTRDTLQE